MLTFRQFIVEDEERFDSTTYNLAALYDGLNAKMFNRELPHIPTTFGKTPKGAAGVTRYMAVKSGLTGKVTTKPETIKMIISHGKYRKDMLYGIVAHEMIHVWCAFTDHYERDSHGMYFQNKRYEVEPKAGFPVPAKDVKLDDEERGPRAVKIVTFIAAGGKPGSDEEIVALFTPGAMDNSTTRAAADVHCKSLVDKLKWGWAIYGSAASVLGDTLTVQRQMKPMLGNIKFYKSKTQLLGKMQVIGSHGQYK